MRFSVVAATALTVAPAMVSAAKGTMGWALGTKEADVRIQIRTQTIIQVLLTFCKGKCKTQQDYELDFDTLQQASGSKLVRGYAAHDCDFAKNALPAAKNKGFQVVLGIWPDVQESFDNDLNAIKQVASTYKDQIYAVTVGSETLYRGNFTGAELRDKINTVKSQLPKGIKVGTADSWNKIADGTADPIIGTADIIMVNAFAFWQGASKDNATHVYLDDMFQAITHIEKIAGGWDKKPEVWNGETGWPTAGMSLCGPPPFPSIVHYMTDTFD